MLIEIGPVGSGIYLGKLISSRLCMSIMNSVIHLESKTPTDSDRNKFTTRLINDSSTVRGIQIEFILKSMYSRLTKEYFAKTGISLVVPTFPNQNCTIKAQNIGQLHEVHTDGGDGDYGMGRILYSSAICLNDDYEGGHTQFYLTGTMEKPNIDIDIKLKAGQALIFNADLNYHGVTEVTSGTRFSLIQFWRE
jgi:predicted 2-oxoglutarate/Fe(II)-dependent dioxygenase YbiX